MNELKLRLILFTIGIFLVGTGHFLSGSWRDEDLGNGAFIPGEPIWEKVLLTESCGNNCTFIKLTTSTLLLFLGIAPLMAFFCPIKLTNDANEVKEE